ncbi:hypothetical protein [Aliarcobacter cryaerophilus]|uniref:hypothetical protein n=1 Tax=Aliarcobacter cryaerophilus TaxID=28198 RepID=UPI00112F1043|nr:hypothetical protein [Aliarcobacter cryaerophilus]
MKIPNSSLEDNVDANNIIEQLSDNDIYKVSDENFNDELKDHTESISTEKKPLINSDNTTDNLAEKDFIEIKNKNEENLFNDYEKKLINTDLTSLYEINPVTKDNNNTPIKKLLDFIKKPIMEDNSELIESMIELSSSLENIGIEAHELTKSLNETEKIRLKLLQEQSKFGLNEEQFPIGKNKKTDIAPIAFVYMPNLKVNLIALEFSQILEDINYSDSNSSRDLIKKAQDLHKILEENKIDPKVLVLNQNQKKSYFKIIYNDDRISRTEFEYILNFMKSSAFANSSIIKKRNEYYKALENKQESEFPDIKPLINDVQKLKNILNVKLEDLSSYMTPSEKKDFEKFLPALDEYYKDQIYAFSGGKCYLPLAKNLRIIQEEIKKNSCINTLIENCQSLGFTMQRLYILHWIAESMMKKNYKTTLGKAIKLHIDKFPEKRSMYSQLIKAVHFRNNIAHNGVIWEPNDFEIHIENYEFGITLIADDLDINLKDFQLQKMNRNMNAKEIEEEVSKLMGLSINEIKKIDPELLKKLDTPNHTKLLKIVTYSKTMKISLPKLINEDLDTIQQIYRSNREIKKILNNHYFTSNFSKKYFNLNFDQLVSKIVEVQKNSVYEKVEKWLFMLSMKEKENKINNNDLETIKDLQRSINGR